MKTEPQPPNDQERQQRQPASEKGRSSGCWLQCFVRCHGLFYDALIAGPAKIIITNVSHWHGAIIGGASWANCLSGQCINLVSYSWDWLQSGKDASLFTGANKQNQQNNR
jgi:hypothetical protein